jgi:hypothetical protein
MQEANREDTLQVGVWTRSNSSLGLFDTKSMHIATITDMIERGATQERLAQLMELEEDKIIVGFHQEVQKEKDKAWHDRHIKKKNFKGRRSGSPL